MSDEFKELPEIEWLRVGSAIPQGTATDREWRAGTSGEYVGQNTTVALDVWFGSGPTITLNEHAISLGRYGRVLTLLTLEEPFDQEEWEYEHALENSWRPHFKR